MWILLSLTVRGFFRVLVPVLCMAMSFDQGDEVGLYGDRLYFDQERGVYVAEGAVEIISGAMKLTCDHAEYSDTTGDFLADGNVLFANEDETVLCDRVEGNLATGLGTFYNAQMNHSKGSYYLKGKRVEKIGKETFQVKKGSLSQCGQERPMWEIRGNRMRVTQGKYLTCKDMTLRIASIPVFYSPYFIFPIKNQRQSGFLPPLLGQGGRNGKTFGLEYFWNLDSNRDGTFTYEYLEDNGNRFGLEYRYAINQGVQGSLFGKYIHDRNADREGSRIGMNQDRWEMGWSHKHRLQENLYGGLFADVFSDGHYLSDFSRSSEARVRNNGQSDLFFVKRWNPGNLSTDFRYYQELGVRREKTTLQSLPEIRLDLVPARIGRSNWFTTLDSSFVNFYRQEEFESTFSSTISSDPRVLTPTTAGQIASVQALVDAGFKPETALRYQGVKGRRLDLFPKLFLPLEITPHSVLTPHVGYRETLYNRSPAGEDFEERGLLQAGFDLTTRLHRDYLLGYGGFLRHIVEPELTYLYIPKRGQEDIPVYDEIDRIDPIDAVHIKLINRFHFNRRKINLDGPLESETMEKREIATLKLDALYDRRHSHQKFRSLFGELDLNFSDNLYLEIHSGYNFEGHDFESLNVDMRYRMDESLTLQIGRRYTDQIPLDPNRPTGRGEFRSIGGNDVLMALNNDGISFWTASTQWDPNRELSMKLTGYFNGNDDTGDDLSFQMSYQKECWGLSLTLDRFDDTVFNDYTQQIEVDKVDEIHLFFTIKSLKLKLFSNI